MKFFGFRSSNKLAQDVAVGNAPDANDFDHAGEKQVTSTDQDTFEQTGSIDADAEEKPNHHVQAGVLKIEAVTLTWTKNELIFAYAW